MSNKPTQRPTPEGFTPPDYKSEYVAYTAEPFRTGNPETGEATELRASVFVREFPEVKVASVERKTKEVRGEEFTYGYVQFDAKSLNVAGYELDFGSNVQVESPAFALLEEAHKRGVPVYVALETSRKARNRDGEQISKAAYIHDLRGANVDGTNSNNNTTRSHCKNTVAAVGVPGDPSSIVFTGESSTDPSEWGSLRKNRDHTLPPNGWRIAQGGIEPSNSGSGGPVDINAVADAVAQRMTSQQGRPSPQRSGPIAAEGKPWEPLNSDGRVNLSSYMVSKTRFTFETATAMLTEHTTPASDPQQFIADAWLLTDLLLWMADAVQSNVTGGRPNRSEGSHKEAARWCALASETLSGTPAGEGLAFPESGVRDREAAQAWANRVVSVATSLFSHTAAQTERHIKGEDAPPAAAPQQAAPTPQADTPGPAPQEQQAPPAAPGQSAGGTVADDAALVAEWEGLLAALNQAEHPERFSPLLSETFGAGVLSHIDADAFRQQIAQWKSNREAFNHEAYAAFERARKSSAPA